MADGFGSRNCVRVLGQTHLLVEAPEWLVLAEHDVHLGAQVVEDARKLQTDVAAADDDELFGHCLQLKDVVADDGVLGALEAQPHRAPAHSDQDILRLQAAVAVRNLQNALASLQMPQAVDTHST